MYGNGQWDFEAAQFAKLREVNESRARHKDATGRMGLLTLCVYALRDALKNHPELVPAATTLTNGLTDGDINAAGEAAAAVLIQRLGQ